MLRSQQVDWVFVAQRKDRQVGQIGGTMVVMVHNKPQWVCSICAYDMPAAGGIALYNRPSNTRHYPQPLIVGGEACASIAEVRLQAGAIERLSWTAFIRALTQAAV
jgi:hypothetical protein